MPSIDRLPSTLAVRRAIWLLAVSMACAPREGVHGDSIDSATATAAVSADSLTPAVLPSAGSTAVRADSPAVRTGTAKTPPATRMPPADSGRIIGRDSARKMDPRDPKRRLPVVPPSDQR